MRFLILVLQINISDERYSTMRGTAGNAMITPLDLEAPGNMIMYEPFETPERLEAFARVAKAAKAHGSLAIVQVSHSGRQVNELINPDPVSASDVQLGPAMGMTFGKPTPLTKEGIKDAVNKVGDTTIKIKFESDH